MNKLFLVIALLVFGVGLSAQESDWSFQSQVGLGLTMYNFDDKFDSRSGPYFENGTILFPAIYFGVELRYKSLGFNIDSYNGGLFPGISYLVKNKKESNNICLTYKFTNHQVLWLGDYSKEDLRHGPGFAINGERFRFGTFFTFIPIKPIERLDSRTFINSFRFHIAYSLQQKDYQNL